MRKGKKNRININTQRKIECYFINKHPFGNMDDYPQASS